MIIIIGVGQKTIIIQFTQVFFMRDNHDTNRKERLDEEEAKARPYWSPRKNSTKPSSELPMTIDKESPRVNAQVSSDNQPTFQRLVGGQFSKLGIIGFEFLSDQVPG